MKNKLMNQVVVTVLAATSLLISGCGGTGEQVRIGAIAFCGTVMDRPVGDAGAESSHGGDSRTGLVSGTAHYRAKLENQSDFTVLSLTADGVLDKNDEDCPLIYKCKAAIDDISGWTSDCLDPNNFELKLLEATVNNQEPINGRVTEVTEGKQLAWAKAFNGQNYKLVNIKVKALFDFASPDVSDPGAIAELVVRKQLGDALAALAPKARGGRLNIEEAQDAKRAPSGFENPDRKGAGSAGSVRAI